MIFKSYVNQLNQLLNTVAEAEQDTILKASELLFNAIKSHHNIFAFGAAHAGILTQELVYRAGGLAVINPIQAAELELTSRPIPKTSKMERLEGYGTIIAENTPLQEGDVVIVHSVSGRNPAIIDFVNVAKANNVTIIAITNVQASFQMSSRHSSGKRLFELADLVIDNHGEPGDASVKLPKLSQKVGPTSTVIGAMIVNSIVIETVNKCLENNIDPPIFYSANVDGGDQKNKEMFQQYASHIFYL